MELYENSESLHKLNNFWELSKVEISNIKTDQITFKSQDLPLARIKKIMKLDEDVKSMMISAEAPILFAKAAEFFIREITLRAWIHTERNKRRTLQRSDITLAVADGDTDQFDFLIDIVPRDEIKTHGATKRDEVTHTQPMHQVAGNLNLFGGNTIHLNTQGLTSNQSTLISGLVDSNSVLQAQASQNTVNVQSQQQVQYVLQIPNGASLGGGQTIQIQMIPQQTILSAGGNNDNSGNAMTSNAGVLNGQQQQIFTLSTGGGGGQVQHHHGTATVVLQPTMMGGAQATQQQQLYSATIAPATAVASTAGSMALATTSTLTSTAGGACVGGPTTDGGQYAVAVIKRDLDDPAVDSGRLEIA